MASRHRSPATQVSPLGGPPTLPAVRRWSAALCLGIALALFASVEAHADARTDYLIRMLRTSDNFRVRLQAALSLGTLGRSEAVPALVAALHDDEPAVRAAAAASLDRLGDPSALSGLRTAQGDSERSVRDAVRHAIRTLERVARERPPSTPPTPPTGTGSRAGDDRYYVGVGSMGTKVAGVSPTTVAAMRDHMRRQLGGVGGVVLAPDGESSSRASQVLRSRHLAGFFVDGSLVSLGPSGAGLRAEVSVIVGTYPGRDIRVMLRGAATVQGVDTSSPRARQDAESQAIEGAVRSACRRMGEAMATSAATASTP